MTIIANFTPDEIRWKHVGQSGVLKPNDITEFDTPRANHILNKWGRRGLVVMRYGEEEEDKRKEAMDIYLSFWKRQIINFNRFNETRKNENRDYVFPDPLLEKKAKDLGIKVIGPWQLEIPVGDAQVAQLKQENAALRNEVVDVRAQLDDVNDKLDTLISAMSGSDEDKGSSKKKGR